MVNAEAQDRESERELAKIEQRSGEVWRAAKDSPYLSLAAGPVAGWVVAWLSMLAWDTVTYAGTAFQYGIALMVMLAFVLRGGRLLARRGPRKQSFREAGQTVGEEKELLAAMRDSGGAITPIAAALQTSLSVSEAERMLCGLAERGHLWVEVRDGALHYSVPGGGFPGSR